MPSNLQLAQPLLEPCSKAGEVFRWYHTLPSRHINLFDDYAGNELFLIEFDSLLLRCFSDPNLDFGYGFQLLHAVYVVEKFLKDLILRKGRFQIICFLQNELLCIPPAANSHAMSKYRLARAVIMRHLQTDPFVDRGIQFHSFESYLQKDFKKFLEDSDAYFIMVHDGAMSGNLQLNNGQVSTPERELDYAPRIYPTSENPFRTDETVSNRPTVAKLRLRAMISWFLTNQYYVVLINEVQFIDNKLLTSIYVHSEVKMLAETTLQPFEPWKSQYQTYDHSQPVQELHSFSEADQVTLLALVSSLEANQISEGDAALFLLHTAALSFLPLQHRYLPTLHNIDSYVHTLSAFTQSALSVILNPACINNINATDISHNLVDLVDGRLLAEIMSCDGFRSVLLAEGSIKGRFDHLCKTLSCICDFPIVDPGGFTKYKITESLMVTLVTNDTILPFKNPAFDRHIDAIHLNIDAGLISLTSSRIQILKELSYWQNQEKAPVIKKPNPQYQRDAKKSSLAQNQNFQKEIQVYAASLTNVSGKILEPQIIVAGSSDHNQKPSAPKLAKHQNLAHMSSKRSKKPGNPNKKGGRTAALEAAAKIKAISMKPKSDMKVNFWRTKCKGFMVEEDLTSRQKLGLQYLQTLDKNDELGPEVQLFTVDCLFRVIASGRADMNKMSITALIWDSIHRLSLETAGVTPEVAIAAEGIIKSLGFLGLNIKANAPSRQLAFFCLDLKTAQKRYLAPLKTPMEFMEFQLEHCGPYLDRSMDSVPDNRVQFEPDGWQRRVLDAIDREESLLVIAPTSAGKTFVSFYAMEKVLQTDDDSVLVYVAPTTALVNQIAAEVHGRFSKNYKHAGRSVWAIHTRDYRINNPTGCQILVTLPHMLQSMLLSPSHAEKKNSWSTRIKRIIFDEIHCIGQGKDGIVWEQLLLQAPCPIIALSATIGNPKELGDWLSLTERANSNEFVTVQHRHRYSSLRTFIYVPPKIFCFSGLPALPDLYIPGLDGSNAFAFVPPVASLANRKKGIPSDFSLEARDCLRLWRVMSQHATERHSIPHSLHPDNILPQLVKKTDIITWEAELKSILRRWMLDDSSPFDLVHRDFASPLEHIVAREIMSTKQSCNQDCDHRNVDADNLKSMMLPVLVDLHAKDALPCLLFNYDHTMCDSLANVILDELSSTEEAWKASKPSWQKKMADFNQYMKGLEIARARAAKAPKKEPKKKKRGEGDEDDEKISRAERLREQAEADVNILAGFNPDAPIDGFLFADISKLTPSELDEMQSELRNRKVPEWLVRGLERGVGVHHSGMNRKYLQTVEVLFRKGFLRVVFATGTLALGINMPCKTVVFAGDSMSLTALNFRQAAGRAGRRGFDVLGNVLFVGIPKKKVFRLLSSRLPDLATQYPLDTSFILRLSMLLDRSNNSAFSLRIVDTIFSRPHLYLGLPESGITTKHHLRFSIEYVRRQLLLDAHSAPINFAECISPLYYTGNSAWAFHALLSKGYFHKLCKDIEINPERVLLTLMLVLSHIFERQPCKLSDIEFIDDSIKHSSSVVFLPPLPEAAKDALNIHNSETLSLFKLYAKTHADQYLDDADDKFPLTQLHIGSGVKLNIRTNASTPPPTIRSPFVALSGHGDEFFTLSELCNTVRSGVFLEESIVPYLQVYGEEVDLPFNAYLLDFFKHGDIRTIVQVNKIQASEIWSRLKYFLNILYTIVGCLSDLTKSMSLSNVDTEAEIDHLGLQDMGKIRTKKEKIDNASYTEETKAHITTGVKNLNVDGQDEESWPHDGVNDKGLLRVLRAFTELHAEFKEKLERASK